MTTPTYFLYRDLTADQQYDPTTPINFYPAKDSDELFDALRAKYPHLKTHSERMRDAVIDFLLEERMAENGDLPVAPSLPDVELESVLWQDSWTSVSPTDLSTPDTASIATPAFTNSPYQEGRYFGATSTSTSPADLDQMTSVFSLTTADQPRQRVRRKMTDAEKVEYRKRRIMKACDKCAKRKRKCTHNKDPASSTAGLSAEKISKISISNTKKSVVQKREIERGADVFASLDPQIAADFDDFTLLPDTTRGSDLDDLFSSQNNVGPNMANWYDGTHYDAMNFNYNSSLQHNSRSSLNSSSSSSSTSSVSREQGALQSPDACIAPSCLSIKALNNSDGCQSVRRQQHAGCEPNAMDASNPANAANATSSIRASHNKHSIVEAMWREGIGSSTASLPKTTSTDVAASSNAEIHSARSASTAAARNAKLTTGDAAATNSAETVTRDAAAAAKVARLICQDASAATNAMTIPRAIGATGNARISSQDISATSNTKTTPNSFRCDTGDQDSTSLKDNTASYISRRRSSSPSTELYMSRRRIPSLKTTWLARDSTSDDCASFLQPTQCHAAIITQPELTAASTYLAGSERRHGSVKATYETSISLDQAVPSSEGSLTPSSKSTDHSEADMGRKMDHFWVRDHHGRSTSTSPLLLRIGISILCCTWLCGMILSAPTMAIIVTWVTHGMILTPPSWRSVGWRSLQHMDQLVHRSTLQNSIISLHRS